MGHRNFETSCYAPSDSVAEPKNSSLTKIMGPNDLFKIRMDQVEALFMKKSAGTKPVVAAVLSSVLVASVLVAPAGAQSSDGLCNGLEPTIVGTDGNDVIQGTFRDDVILAGAGNDQIRGASGNDVICGGAGNDTIYGDSQDDIIFGEAGNDVIFGGSGADEIRGGDGNDNIRGESQDDLIFGDAGNDVLNGGSDSDEVHGGSGNDEIFGESQNDLLFGDAGNDTIDGGPNSDTLDGGPGNDVLDGSFQDDTCSGGEELISCENVTSGTSFEGPVLLSNTDIAWQQGLSEWVPLMWTTDVDLTNVEVRVTATSDGLEVAYPSDSDRSRLAEDSDLSTSEIDFTAVRLSTAPGDAQTASIEISWDNVDGERESRDFDLSLTNQVYEGEDFAILTEAATIGSDVETPELNWVDLDYTGISPQNSGIRITVDSEFTVHYPQDTYTSLYHDELLLSSETEVARVWFDPALVEPGTSSLVATVEYVDTNGVSKSVSHTVELTVN